VLIVLIAVFYEYFIDSATLPFILIHLLWFARWIDEKAFGQDGYGAKASSILMQVRGKDFRHEKTKKKRGSYRGGEITLASNSFKYADSD
jgi:hypothetical protein